MTSPLDYDSDKDPLGYMTTDYPSPYLAESQLDMQRRFFVRGRQARHGWQRLLVRLIGALFLLAVLYCGVMVVWSVMRAVFG